MEENQKEASQENVTLEIDNVHQILNFELITGRKENVEECS